MRTLSNTKTINEDIMKLFFQVHPEFENDKEFTFKVKIVNQQWLGKKVPSAYVDVFFRGNNHRSFYVCDVKGWNE